MAQLSSLTGRCAPLQSNRVAARPARRSGRVACSALPPSPPGITFGCHAQVWCGDWQKADIENAVQGSKKAGFDLVEVNVSVPDEVDAKLTKSILDANGMGSSASMGLALKHDISSEDNGVVADGKEHLIKCLQKVNDMGGKVMAGVNYCAMHKYGGPASATSRRNCATTLKELAARAADMGIVYSIEVVNRYETNIANTGAMAMDLLDEAGNPDNLTVHLDTYHMNIEESAMDHAIGICGDKLAYVHVGESHRGYLGTGSIDWGSFWQALAKHNYKGPITFESFSSAVVSASLSNTLCVWRNLWDDSEDLATSANAFMRSGVHAAYKIPRVKSSA